MPFVLSSNSLLANCAWRGSGGLRSLTAARHGRKGTPPFAGISSLSTWTYDHNNDGVVTEKDYARARHLVALKQQTKALTRHVQTVARRHLNEHFPASFALQSTDELWTHKHHSMSYYTHNNKNQDLMELTDPAQTLLTLNGFKEVAPPTAVEMLNLAEGVVALPNIHSRISSNRVPYRLFAQPVTDKEKLKSNKKYPAIVQQDIQLYRVLENYAENWINRIYSGIVAIIKREIVDPSLIAMNRVVSSVERIRPGTKKITNEANSAAEIGNPTESVQQVALPADTSIAESKDREAVENLLVLSRTEVILYREIPPATRLVALPYSLAHKSASTLISVSLVVFGALPLAYRSYNFAFLYPWMSEALAGSVIFTICYGIWSQRYYARMSQSYAVTKALWHRVAARDDAVLLWALQEGAVQQFSKALLAEYLHRLPLARDEIEFLDIPQVRRFAPLVSGTSEDSQTAQQSISNAAVDPLELAVSLGLIERKTAGVDSAQYKAVPLTKVMAKVDSLQKG